MSLATGRHDAAHDRSTRWLLAGVGLYVAGAIASLFAIAFVENVFGTALGLDVWAGTEALSIRNGTWPVAWGLIVAAAAVPLGRRLVPSISFAPWAVLVLLAGLTLAGLTEYQVDEFVRRRMGIYDPEYAGLALFAAPAVVGVALATWATLALPRHVVATGLALLAVAALAIAVLPSIPGAADGIRAENVPIAIVFLLDGAFAAVAAALVLSRLVRSP